MTDRIQWEQGETVDPKTGQAYRDHLTAKLGTGVNVGLRVDDEGDYIIAFVVGVYGAMRTLPEVEAFILRCGKFLDEEPVEEID